MNSRTPFFSIVIPTYNRSSDLKFALFCILRQDFKSFEIIVSDNCSPDDTRKTVKSFNDLRIKYFKNSKNIGVRRNISKSFRYALGKYVFLHSDDDFLLYENSLRHIYDVIHEYHPGFLRVNYLTRDPSRKKIFSFHPDRQLSGNKFIPPHASDDSIVNFLFGSDMGFISGIIFINKIPKNVDLIESELAMWVKILFYATKAYGGYFISKPHIIASWSEWSSSANPLYALIAGKLSSEAYFDFMKDKMSRDKYIIFRRQQFMGIYVKQFPGVKYYVGNKNMLELLKRLRQIDNQIDKNIFFWMYLGIALILPRAFLKILKHLARSRYTGRKVKGIAKIHKEVKMLEQLYKK